MRGIFGREPALVIGALTAVLVLLVQFGINITDEQQKAIINVATAVLVLGGAAWTRQNVASPYTLRKGGTTIKEVEAAADPNVAVKLHLIGPDTMKVKAQENQTVDNV
jgi:hypothetical protein